MIRMGPLSIRRISSDGPAKGDRGRAVIGSTPEHGIPRYYVTLLSAIRNAEKSIWVSAAYFVPTDQEEEDLLAAARRGVDVRLLLPATAIRSERLRLVVRTTPICWKPVSRFMKPECRAPFQDRGHRWCMVGGRFLEFRPAKRIVQYEVDAVVLGGATARELQAMFENDTRKRKQIDFASWRRRSPIERLNELYSTIWQDWL